MGIQCAYGGVPLRKAFRTWIWASKGNPINNFYGQYKNPNDKRVAGMMQKGCRPREYDWWNIQQVKNVNAEKTAHPCQIPVTMAEKIIDGATKSGDTVLDLFSGSGTCAEACKRMNRRCIAIESSEEYCGIIEKRIANTQKNLL